jgi:hypothetical protein
MNTAAISGKGYIMGTVANAIGYLPIAVSLAAFAETR